MLVLISRKNAKAQGLSRYYNGNPCQKGHDGQRFVANGSCCDCEVSGKKRRYTENPEPERQRCRRWQKENPEWIAGNAALAAARARAWYKDNRERAKKNVRLWKSDNQDRRREHGNLRRARKIGAPGHYKEAQIKAMLAAQNLTCAACPASLAGAYHRDHITPLSRGGSNGIENIQLLCPACNLSKGAKTAVEWDKSKVSRLGAPC